MAGVASAIAIGGSAVIGAGASMSAANKAGKASREAANRQEQMSAKELAFRQAMFDYEKQMTQPLRQKLTDEAMSSEPLDYAGTSAKIKQGYGEARRRLAEQGYGTGTAGTGLGATNAQALDLGEASDLAGAWAQGMSAKRGLGTQLLGYGNFTGAQQGLAGAMQGQANLYGQQASQYGQAAQQGWANAGKAIDGAIRDLARQQKTPTPNPTPTPGGHEKIPESTPTSQTPYQSPTPLPDLPAPYEPWRNPYPNEEK